MERAVPGASFISSLAVGCCCTGLSVPLMQHSSRGSGKSVCSALWNASCSEPREAKAEEKKTTQGRDRGDESQEVSLKQTVKSERAAFLLGLRVGLVPFWGKVRMEFPSTQPSGSARRSLPPSEPK